MSGAERPDQGSSEAHTPAHAPAAAGAGDAGAIDQAAVDLFDSELGLFQEQTIAPKRGRGRPPGSPNRTTLQLKALLLAKGYRHPAEFLAATMSMDVRQMAQHLDIDTDKALSAQIRAAEALMPYYEQKMPTAVENAPAEARPLFVIGSVGQMQVNQSLSGDGAARSHGDGSQISANALIRNDKQE